MSFEGIPCASCHMELSVHVVIRPKTDEEKKAAEGWEHIAKTSWNKFLEEKFKIAPNSQLKQEERYNDIVEILQQLEAIEDQYDGEVRKYIQRRDEWLADDDCEGRTAANFPEDQPCKLSHGPDAAQAALTV
eukprot:2583495-Rhodomonas_salina.1